MKTGVGSMSTQRRVFFFDPSPMFWARSGHHDGGLLLGPGDRAIHPGNRLSGQGSRDPLLNDRRSPTADGAGRPRPPDYGPTGVVVPPAVAVIAVATVVRGDYYWSVGLFGVGRLICGFF